MVWWESSHQTLFLWLLIPNQAEIACYTESENEDTASSAGEYAEEAAAS